MRLRGSVGRNTPLGVDTLGLFVVIGNLLTSIINYLYRRSVLGMIIKRE